MTAKQLIDKYCTCPLVGDHPGETPPRVDTMPNHRAEALIDGNAYFTAIREEIRTLGNTTPNRFFYMTAWWLGVSSIDQRLLIDNKWSFPPDPPAATPPPPPPKLTIPGLTLPASNKPFEKQLEDLVQKGVDVRVLPWAFPFANNEKIVIGTDLGALYFHTLLSVRNLRKLLGSPDRVVLNLLAHTWGGAHCKLIVCGDDNGIRAYTSGLDPVYSRLDPPGFSKTQVIQSTICEHHASEQEISTLCDDLDQCQLPAVLYNKLRQFYTAWPLPDFASLSAGINVRYFVWSEVRSKGRQWQLNFVEQDPNDPSNPSKCWFAMFFLTRDSDRTKNRYRIVFKEWKVGGGWHDAGVKVEGDAAYAIYDFFKTMWNEQLARDVDRFNIDGQDIVSHQRDWNVLKDRKPINPLPNLGTQYVQVLRTTPMMDFSLGKEDRGNLLVPDDFKPKKFGIKGLRRLKIGREELLIPAGMFAPIVGDYVRRPLSFAPKGCFEFKVALKRAISQAEKYVFIADQSLYALEVMDWINERLQRQPTTLKVILLYGADPADPPNSFLAEAINNHLLKGVNRNQLDGQPTNVVFYEWIGSAVHCKVTIIDDVWCAIGSANCMRRSLYTDIELSVSIVEPETATKELPASGAEEANPAAHNKKAPSFVQRFRRDLWAHYFGLPLGKRTDDEKDVCAGLLFVGAALSVWNPQQWRAPVRKFTLPGSPRPEIVRQNLNPFPVPQNPFDQTQYDRKDPDSRKPY